MDIRSILCYKNPLLDSTSTLSNHSNSLLFFAEKLLKNVVFTFPTPLLPFSLEPTLIKLSPSALVKVPSDLHVASSRGQFSVINLPNLSAAFDIADLSLLLVHFLHLAPVASTSPDFPSASLTISFQPVLLIVLFLPNLLILECTWFSALSTLTHSYIYPSKC